ENDRNCVAVRREAWKSGRLRAVLRRRRRMDGGQSPRALVSRDIFHARSDAPDALPSRRVLERDARLRAAQAISLGCDRTARETARRARRVGRTARHLHRARRTGSSRADVVAPHLTASRITFPCRRVLARDTLAWPAFCRLQRSVMADRLIKH